MATNIITQYIPYIEYLANVERLDKLFYYFHDLHLSTHTVPASLVWLNNVKNHKGILFR